jgi:hypothetical protein
VEFQYRAEIGLKTSLLSPGNYDIKQHRDLIMPTDLLSSLLSRWVATVDDWPIPVAVELLQEGDVAPFVNRVLLSPKRALPGAIASRLPAHGQ